MLLIFKWKWWGRPGLCDNHLCLQKSKLQNFKQFIGIAWIKKKSVQTILEAQQKVTNSEDL